MFDLSKTDDVKKYVVRREVKESNKAGVMRTKAPKI